MVIPKPRVCEYCYFVTTVKHKKCPSCGNENKPKERVMKWTEQKDIRMMNLISEHNKLSDGFAHAAKKLKCSKSAIANRYYKVMKKFDPTGDTEPTTYPWDGNIMIDKQKYGRALRKADKNTLIIDMADESLAAIRVNSMSDLEKTKWATGEFYDDAAFKEGFARIINPPISCEAGAINCMQGPKIEKPKTFCEKLKAFFKGGNHEQ